MRIIKCSETYCYDDQASIWCSMRASNNIITQNDIDTQSSALTVESWVIDSIITLPSNTSYIPGPSLINNDPTIWIINNGQLIISNTYNTSITGWIYLCNNAEFHVVNSNLFTISMDFSFQYWFWAAHHSKISMINSTISLIDDIMWFQAIRGNSTITVRNITILNFGVWEFAVLDNSYGIVDSSQVYAEMYISLNATLIINNTQYFDIFFSICSNDAGQQKLGNLPIACDIAAFQCNTVNHPNIDYFELSPPLTTFRFIAENVKIWAFAVEISDFGDVIFNDIHPLSNFVIGLNIGATLQTDYNLSLIVGDNPIISGLEETRSIQFEGDNVYIMAYMLWANGINVNILPSSEVGDVYLTGTPPSFINGDDLVLNGGNIRVEHDSQLILSNTVINEHSIILENGMVIFEHCIFNCNMDTAINNRGYIFMIQQDYNDMNNCGPSTISIDGGYLWNINITTDDIDMIVINDGNIDTSFDINGNIIEINDNSFDCKVILMDNNNDNIIWENHINSNIVDDVILNGTFMDILNGGIYKLVIRFNIINYEIDVFTKDILVIFENELIVVTEYGAIRGVITESNTRYFTSIPYASPPIDSLRFLDPIDPPNWNNILNTTIDPPGCMQICGGNVYCPNIINEDCLYLNVFTPFPLNNDSQLLPVSVYIHGGSWLNGHSAPFGIFNATNIVRNTNTIIVTINYRLNIFGLFYYNDYNDIFSGNYGIKDVIKALQWIQHNIFAFGGDKDKVTLFGYSVGSGIAAILLTMENDIVYKLFNAAVIASNPFFGAPLRTKNNWNKIPKLVLNYTNCDEMQQDIDLLLDCIRNIDAMDLLLFANRAMSSVQYDDEELIFNAVRWTPTIDGIWIKKQPLIAFKENRFHPTASIMIGVSTNETLGITFGTFMNLDNTYNSFTIYLQKLLGDNIANKILDHYGLPTNMSDIRYPPYASLISTDGRYICPSYQVALYIAEHRNNIHSLKNSVYHFRYNVSVASEISPISWLPHCEEAVCHNSENPIIWNPPKTNIINFTLNNDELELSNVMQSFWSNLIKTVNDKQYFLWNGSFNIDTKYTMLFNNGSSIGIVSNLDEEICQFWNDIGYLWLPSLIIDDEDKGWSPEEIAFFIVILVIGIVIIASLIYCGLRYCNKTTIKKTEYDSLL